MLESLGLGTDAVAVYRAILASPRFGVAELVTSLDWPVDRVRAALDELGRLSLVRPSWEKPGSLRPVSPELGLASLLARQEQDLLQRQQEIAASRIAVTRLISEHADLYPMRLVPEMEQLTGIDEIRSRIEEMAAACRTEMLAFAPRGAQSATTMEASKPLDQAVLDRGVQMRTVYVHGVYNDHESLHYARWLANSGAHVRTAPALSLRLIVYDRERALVPTDPDAETVGAVLMQGTGVVGALCELFEHVWEQSIPLGAERPRRGGGDLTGQEQAVVRLLADGLTDEVIARRLGVSVRTGRRITAELMARLSARSRFQAGVRAMELGLLGRPPTAEQEETGPL
jgi:DNA-binding CsgD family transcriptional regulator/sugar-specific transcriptional regulator TrmB